MRPLLLPDGPLRLLALGAHADDIEIGAGGTIRRLLRERPGSTVRWVVLSGNEMRAAEARASAATFVADAAHAEVRTYTFRDGFFPTEQAAIKQTFETDLKGFAPDLVLTHFRDDRHQDHRVVSDLTWNTFRTHLIWEYEILKVDGDLGQPNLYVSMSEADLVFKVQALLTHFPSQRAKHWFDAETFRSLPRIRGVEAAVRYAEAFYARKVVL